MVLFEERKTGFGIVIKKCVMQYSREKGAGTRERGNAGTGPPLPLPFQALLDELVWYTGGPSVQFLPLTVPDPKRRWGSKKCKNCNGFARGSLFVWKRF